MTAIVHSTRRKFITDLKVPVFFPSFDKDKDPELRAKLFIARTSFSEALLNALATDPDAAVRETLANNHRAPKAALDMLALDRLTEVRVSVAENPNTRPATLTLLSRDAVPGVRWKTVSNTGTPWEVLDQFVERHNEDMNVLRSVAENTNCHPKTLEALSKKTAFIQRAWPPIPTLPVPYWTSSQS